MENSSRNFHSNMERYKSEIEPVNRQQERTCEKIKFESFELAAICLCFLFPL